ncbi:MAG: hypothetical protein RR364_02240 [Lachnospiraceae bacterium]
MELESLEGLGISIWIEGLVRDAAAVTNQLLVNEVSNYMRDYVLDDGGKLRELRFDRIGNYKQ